MTQEVYEFRERTGFPGMKVLQFAFDPSVPSDYLPHNLTENAVLYTGTHDNDTIASWVENASPEEFLFARQYLGLSEEEGYVWGMMRAAATTVCQTVIFQMQDLFGLGEDSRMNRPGRAEGNWQWRMPPGSLTLELASRLRELHERPPPFGGSWFNWALVRRTKTEPPYDSLCQVHAVCRGM